jgi:hypothetical protein
MKVCIHIDKVFPIEGREDFFKYVVMDNGELARDVKKEVMYFDRREEAQAVRDALIKVEIRLRSKRN